MLEFRAFMLEEPEVRVKRTKHARPRLASQAPKVRMIKIRKAWFIDRRDEENEIKNARERIIASKERSAIKIWWRWETIVKMGARHMKGVIENKVITLRVGPIFGLQDRCLEF